MTAPGKRTRIQIEADIVMVAALKLKAMKLKKSMSEVAKDAVKKILKKEIEQVVKLMYESKAQVGRKAGAGRRGCASSQEPPDHYTRIPVRGSDIPNV